MRIRKRQVPLPLSSLSPVPLSDPRLNPSPLVQLHHHQNTTQPKPSHPNENLPLESDLSLRVRSQPSDQPNQCLLPIGGGRDGPDYSDAGGAQKESLEVLQGGGEEVKKHKRGGELGEKSNDTRKGISILGAEVGTEVLPQSSCSSQVGRWCEGEKAFPLKKRRGSFERRVREETITEKGTKMKTKMKTKMNKKCVLLQNENEQETRETKEGVGVDSTSAKKRARGGALMEGSRCSRVNGRGWRCCQQTLVGYSLCEHHLGKGRLRSMTSVRSRSLASTSTSTTSAPKDNDQSEPLSSSSLTLEENEMKRGLLDDENEKKPLIITKKRMKLGMVKARSISSLLGEANNAIAVADNNNK